MVLIMQEPQVLLKAVHMKLGEFFFKKTRDPDLEHSSEPLGDYCV